MEYRVIRSSRKTIAIEIAPGGELLVRCPRLMAKRDIQRFVESRRDWITAHLERLENLQALPPMTPQEHQALIRQARQVIPRRTAYFADLLGVSYGRISIRSQRTRWGSCSAQGNLNFNCLLLLAPSEVLDYVIVHELCHRLEMNHSPKFWARVETLLPDYRSQRHWLKENGNSLMARLPKEISAAH